MSKKTYSDQEIIDIYNKYPNAKEASASIGKYECDILKVLKRNNITSHRDRKMLERLQQIYQEYTSTHNSCIGDYTGRQGQVYKQTLINYIIRI